MQLDQYISDLLYRYECVIVPEFGAFLTQYKSAQLSTNNNTFYPPKKVISFNNQLINNDGILVDYIASCLKISYEEANKRVIEQVNEINTTLKRGTTIVLKNIGELTKKEAHLHFEPTYSVNYLTEAFGLNTFSSTSINRGDQKRDDGAIVLQPTPQHRPWLKYAAVGAIAIMATTFGGYNYLNKVKTHNIAAQQSATKQIEQQLQHATFAIENPLPAITVAFSQPVGNYHIVGGAFRAKENAQKRVAQLTAKGYNAHILGVNSFGLHQVAFDSYATAQEAKIALQNIRKNDQKSAWLLVK